MKCFVTGASGFIGSNLVHELLARGHRVKALLRPGADERGLQGLKFDRVTGDILDRKLLQREMEGYDWCFHVAASYQLWMRNYAPMYEINVEGTRNVLEAAGHAGCRKIVYTSTVGCIGVPHNGIGNETLPCTLEEMAGDYKRSKFMGEQVALEFAAKGLPVVIVNPTAPMGDHDFKPTPTGQIVVDFLRGAMPAYIDTGLNVVNVKDVATGHLLACERGKAGERYILGSENLTLGQILRQLAEITHRKAPTIELPYFVAWLAGAVGEAVANVTGKPPRASLEAVRMAKKKMWVTHEKAAKELGYAPQPARNALADAVDWFQKQ